MRRDLVNVVALLKTAVRHQQSGQLDEARKLYEQVLRLQPKNYDALNQLGLVLAAQGEAPRGIQLIKRALEAVPRSPGALNNLGCLLLGLQRSKEALANFDKATSLKADFVEAWINRGVALGALD